MKAEQVDFISSYLLFCPQGGRKFPDQSDSDPGTGGHRIGLGTERLAREHHNFFGITAYGKKNVWWKGEGIELGVHSLRFRVYDTPQDSFMDYARLIRHAYTPAADVSNNPQAFARSISYSRYISEVNGDNREAYRILLIKLCRQIEKIKD